MGKKKYPEIVKSRFCRYFDGEEVHLFRDKTVIIFGNSDIKIGSAMMTNPGGYELESLKDWVDFKNGRGNYDYLEGEDVPDKTMEIIIDVVRLAYNRVYGTMPDGYLPIYNQSNLVETDSNKAEGVHIRLLKELKKSEEENKLLDSNVYDEKARSEWFLDSPFIIAGFAKTAFPRETAELQKWISNKKLTNIVYSLENGRWSHPTRWFYRPYLKEQAAQNLASLLEKKNRNSKHLSKP
ncbi:hypothetical protein [Neobacillus muris]|uniref:hypothetical protein n=1 Tax=Neobacillus muris TaxID=2941334 RepID=UPI00203DA75D|nr:hypothetical protein [Neobacillus muris]